MCHRCGEHRSNCICTPSKSELKRRAAQTDAPERTPLSERITQLADDLSKRDTPAEMQRMMRAQIEMLRMWADEVAALEQECEHQREIINGSDHLSRIAALEQERKLLLCNCGAYFVDALEGQYAPDNIARGQKCPGCHEVERLRAAIREWAWADEARCTRANNANDVRFSKACAKLRALTDPEGE